MFFLIIALYQQSWDDYYTNIQEPEKEIFGNIDKRSLFNSVENNNVYVTFSVFNSCSSTGSSEYGGAICFQQSNSKVLVEFCTFYHCSNLNTYGGAIFKSAGDCIITKTCGVRCSTPSYGQFIRTSLDSSSDIHRNEIIECCITESGEDFSNQGSQVISLYGSAIKILTTNFSDNHVQTYSAAGCYPNEYSTIDYECYINYCQISTNTAEQNVVLWFRRVNLQINPQHLVENCNIIRNTQKANNANNGLFHGDGVTVNVNHCSFSGNSGQYIFYGNVKTMNLNDCYLPDDQRKGININWGNSVSEFSILTKWFETENCYIMTDSSGNIKTWVDIPKRIPTFPLLRIINPYTFISLSFQSLTIE